MIFPHTVTVIELVQDTDALGGVTYTPRIVVSGLTCFVQPVSDGDDQRNKQIGHSVLHRIYFPERPEISDTKNRIIWVDRFGIPRQLRFLAHRDATSGLGLFWRVDCEEPSVWNESGQ